MKDIHFYKAKSRLGLINPPYGSEEMNLGVENGPESILSEEFLSSLHNYKVSDVVFPLPDKSQKKNYTKVIKESTKNFQKLINDSISENEMQVVIGGDHSISLGAATAFIKRSKGRVGLINFDSHGDLHNYFTTPSGNFHGMWLRSLLESNQEKLKFEDTFIIGNLDLEAEEKDYIKKNQIRNIAQDNINKDFDFVRSSLNSLLSRIDHLYITFDIDVFDGSIVKATGTVSNNGLKMDEVDKCLELIKDFKSKSIDLVEFNPTKFGSKETLKIAQNVLLNLIT